MMISKLLNNHAIYLAGTPVQIVGMEPGDMYRVMFPNGNTEIMHGSMLHSGHDDPEETIPGLAQITGIGYDTLAKAAREGRLVARKSGGTYISTRDAVEYAISTGAIRAYVKPDLQTIDFDHEQFQSEIREHGPEIAREMLVTRLREHVARICSDKGNDYRERQVQLAANAFLHQAGMSGYRLGE